MTDNTPALAALERLAEIETDHYADEDYCEECYQDWPCDAIQLARAVRAQRELLWYWAHWILAAMTWPETKDWVAPLGAEHLHAMAAAPSREGEA